MSSQTGKSSHRISSHRDWTVFFLNAHDCLAIVTVVVVLIFKLHLFQMIRIVERAVSSDSSCLDSVGSKAPTFTRVNGYVSITGHKRLQNLGPFKRTVTWL
jgi:hypothetical protein